jgi:hypothetical protein
MRKDKARGKDRIERHEAMCTICLLRLVLLLLLLQLLQSRRNK